MSATIHMDLDEGRTTEMGCLACHTDTVATIGIASPFRFYVAALDCGECQEQLVEFDAISDEVIL